MHYTINPSNLQASSAAAAAAAEANDRRRAPFLSAQQFQHWHATSIHTEQSSTSLDHNPIMHNEAVYQPPNLTQTHPDWTTHPAIINTTVESFVDHPELLRDDKEARSMSRHPQEFTNPFTFRPLDGVQPDWLSSSTDFLQYEQLPVEDWALGMTDEGSSVSSVTARDYYSTTPEVTLNHPTIDQSQVHYHSNNQPIHANPHSLLSGSYFDPANSSAYGLMIPNAPVFQQYGNPNFPNFQSWLTTHVNSEQSQYVSMDEVVRGQGCMSPHTPGVAVTSTSGKVAEVESESESESEDEKSGKSEDEETIDSSKYCANVNSHHHGQGDRQDTPGVRDDRDNLLVNLRQKGWKYKDIKREHGFTEAESTLRGRYRTLTKKKEQRVRKPEWQARDVTLLRKAVNHIHGNRQKKLSTTQIHRKTPWKKVSERMTARGSSYAFAASTCAKKWEEVFGGRNSN